jgi:hypothetical protein
VLVQEFVDHIGAERERNTSVVFCPAGAEDSGEPIRAREGGSSIFFFSPEKGVNIYFLGKSGSVSY